MAPEILQLLLLLSLGNSGKPGRTWAESQPQKESLTSPGSRGQKNQAAEEHKRQEGETFRVICSYESQENKTTWMTWCKKGRQEDCDVLPSKNKSKFLLSDNEDFSSYENNNGTITITITFKLRVNDSGDYECGIPDSNGGKVVLRTFHLVVFPATTFRTTECSPPATETSLTTSATPLAINSSIKKKFFILGVVLSCLLLSVLLVVGIICTRRIYQKAGKGNDAETQGQKSKGSSMKMDSDAEDIHYATVSKRSPRELTNVKNHTPVESVEYATITRN